MKSGGLSLSLVSVRAFVVEADEGGAVRFAAVEEEAVAVCSFAGVVVFVVFAAVGFVDLGLAGACGMPRGGFDVGAVDADVDA